MANCANLRSEELVTLIAMLKSEVGSKREAVAVDYAVHAHVRKLWVLDLFKHS